MELPKVSTQLTPMSRLSTEPGETPLSPLSNSSFKTHKYSHLGAHIRQHSYSSRQNS